MSDRYPLRVTRDQWNDIREHYEEEADAQDFEERPETCMECGRELEGDEGLLCSECIDSLKSIIKPLDIQPDEHLMGEYDEANGDLEPY